MITVQSIFKLDPDTRSEVMRMMENMVTLCKQERGCISYEYFQGITDSSQVVLLQEWESADDLQCHYQTRHMEEFLAKLNNYLSTPVTTRSFASQKDTSRKPARSRDSGKPQQTIH